MSEVTQHNIENKLDTSLKSLTENEWMHNLWVWADEHNIDTKELPREKHSLLELKSLTLLKSLKKLCLCHNVNLVLTQEQKEWVRMIEKNGTEVSYDEGLLDKYRVS